MVNERLQRARIQKQFEVEYICRKTGISEKTYRRLEAGTHTPRQSTRDSLCLLFGMTPEELGFFSAHAQANTPAGVPALPMNSSPSPPNLLDPFSIALFALALTQQTQGWSLDEFLSRVDREMRGYSTMLAGRSFEGTDVERTGMKIPRRDFFQEMFISSLLFANLGDEQYAALTQLFSGDYLSVFEQELASRWAVYHKGHSASAHQGLQLWLGATELYAKEQTSSRQRNNALVLASMGHQLQGSIYRDWMSYEQAHNSYRQSFLLSDELGDLEVKASSLARRGVTFIQQQKSIEAIEYLESALSLLGELHASHLRGYILQALSEAHAMARHDHASDEHINLAEKVLQENSNIEERSHCQLNTTSVTAQRGVNAVLLGQYQKAIRLIEAGLAVYSPNLLRGRARLIAQQAEAYFRLGLIDHAAKSAIEALTIASSIKSQKTIMRVRFVYGLLAQSPYRGEKNVVQLQTMLS